LAAHHEFGGVARSVFTGDARPKSLVVRIERHAKGQVFTLETVRNLTNTRGRMPNDRPHMFRVMGTVDVPRTGLVVGANLQYFSGKPWAASAQITLPQGDQRVQLEPRGARRLWSQSLLDLRLSRPISTSRGARIELLVDVLNVLNDDAEEELATDKSVQPEFRITHRLHGSASRHDQREAESGTVGREWTGESAE
jgi:hypothetical protein